MEDTTLLSLSAVNSSDFLDRFVGLATICAPAVLSERLEASGSSPSLKKLIKRRPIVKIIPRDTNAATMLDSEADIIFYVVGITTYFSLAIST
tara:strand:+ start:1180 stop:1458 length:279 start_codon:yes stop_codon:yes gene_type:complete